MNGKLLIGSLSCSFPASSSSCRRLGPTAPISLPTGWATRGWGTAVGGTDVRYGPNLPSPAPYFAMHPPVYYSYPVAYALWI